MQSTIHAAPGAVISLATSASDWRAPRRSRDARQRRRRAEAPVKLERGRARADRPARPRRPDRGVQRAAGDRRDRRRRSDPAGGARPGQRGGLPGTGRGRDQPERAEQIARHVTRALGEADGRLAG